MNYAEQFFDSLHSLNEFVFDRAVLQYQREIIEQGSFSLLSPWTGESLVPTACYIANNGDPAHGNIGIAYRVDSEPVLWLLASSIKDGFPITEAYLPSPNTSIWSLSEAYCEENAHWKVLLRKVEQDIERDPECVEMSDAAQQAPVILMGHPNFAHNLWNELAALRALTQTRAAGKESLHINAIYEPLVPLEQVAASPALSVSRIESFEQLLGFKDTMVTRLGSTQIPAQLREMIRELACERRDKLLTDPLIDSLRGCSPVIWLSVRLDARTPDNQQAFLLGLITRIAAVYPDAGFILDGFSYPDDFGSAIYQSACAKSGLGAGFLSAAMTGREQEISVYVRDLQASLEERLPNTIVNTSGMSLVNSIFLARAANYYVCHAGTLQHKIAWIYNIDGIVHSNTTGVQKGVQNWLADQLQDGVKPSLVSADYVKDLDSIRTTNKVERNRDYHILDVGRVIEQILGDLQVSMARLPATSVS